MPQGKGVVEPLPSGCTIGSLNPSLRRRGLNFSPKPSSHCVSALVIAYIRITHDLLSWISLSMNCLAT